jgi:chitin synthase
MQLQFTLQQQKYTTIAILLLWNAICSGFYLAFWQNWYAFTFVTALASTANCLCIVGIFVQRSRERRRDSCALGRRRQPRNYVYVVPCYNESEEDIFYTLQSVAKQHVVQCDRRMIIVVCDGSVKGANNDLTTDTILKELLRVTAFPKYVEYETWNGQTNVVSLYSTIYDGIPLLLLVKSGNVGKRDTLVLVRRALYAYNHNQIACDLDELIVQSVSDVFDNFAVDYLIGMDADTIFDYNTTYELVADMDDHPQWQGTVGLVVVDLNRASAWNVLVMYQHAEYLYAQLLRRLFSALCTESVTCLSGCGQIMRISDASCGPVALQEFNRWPAAQSLRQRILAFASEDRRSVMIMLRDGANKTGQTLSARVTTTVPLTLAAFFRQRRRWLLGATCNDLEGMFRIHNKVERVLCGVNVLSAASSPFLCVTTGVLISRVVRGTLLASEQNWLWLLILVPYTYSVLLPWLELNRVQLVCTVREKLYYWVCLHVKLVLAPLFSCILFLRCLLQLDDPSWGSVRD